jgi:hypothetical protein
VPLVGPEVVAMKLECPLTEYIPLRAYQGILFKDLDIILRSTSALIQLELFLGYIYEIPFQIYSKVELGYENVNCIIVDSFDGIDYEIISGVKCTTANWTFNDIFSRLYAPNSDEDFLALTEGLAEYWHNHNCSYDGLTINPSNLAEFNEIKDWPREALEDGYC